MSKIVINKQSKKNMNKCGIYMIKNTINEKIYIGMTRSSFTQRLKEHNNLLKTNKHHNIHLQNSFNKYSVNSFEFIVLEVISKFENNLKYFLEREDYFMHHNDALSENGYNLLFSKNQYYDLSQLDDKFLSDNVRKTIENILYEKEIDSELINALLELKNVGEMIEYFNDCIAENDDEVLGFFEFLDKHLLKNKINWKVNGFINDRCRQNECIALDDYTGYCKFYECNINELNYFEKQKCNNGEQYYAIITASYYNLKEGFDIEDD